MCLIPFLFFSVNGRSEFRGAHTERYRISGKGRFSSMRSQQSWHVQGKTPRTHYHHYYQIPILCTYILYTNIYILCTTKYFINHFGEICTIKRFTADNFAYILYMLSYMYILTSIKDYGIHIYNV